MTIDYKARVGEGKQIALFLWLCALLWLSTGCGASAANAPTSFPEAEFGAVTTTSAINNANAPLDSRGDFSRDDGIIYVVVEVKRVEPQTVLQVVWRSEALDFEERSAPLTADKRYENVYVEFHLEPLQGDTLSALEAGDYEVQLLVNDKAGPITTFRIR